MAAVGRGRSHAPGGGGGRVRRDLWLIGLLGLVVAALAAGGLVYKHFTGHKLPGCGEASACDQIESHPLGSVGGMWISLRRLAMGEQVAAISAGEAFWPASFLGLALFGALLAAWVMVGARSVGRSGDGGGGGGGGVPVWLRWVARAGALASAIYTTVMVVSGHICPYCLTAHAGNLLFWIMMEVCVMSTKPQRLDLGSSMKSVASRLAADRRARGGGGPGLGALLAAVAAFALTSGVLGVMHAGEMSSRRSNADAEMDRALQDIIGKSSPSPTASDSTPSATDRPSAAATAADPAEQQPPTQNTPPKTPTDTAARPIESAPSTTIKPSAQLPWEAGGAGFTGRYRLGPEDAAIRVVLFMDYQCPDCRRVESEIEQFMNENGGRTDTSLSVKHFPMSNACNPHLSANMHPNACWAARAAETAGMLRGNDGFWQMHRWLFGRAGSFTDAELNAGLQSLGYNPSDIPAFTRLMQSPETLTPVQNDIEEAILLGLYFTPMVFVNGVEVRGWEVPGNVKKFLDQLAGRDLPPGKATDDHPVLAAVKLIDDWQKGFRVKLPADESAWVIGASEADAKATVVFWGDYQEVNTRKLDAAIRKAMTEEGGRPWVRYSFRQFPTAAECNPVLQGRTIHPQGCLASRAAEAAGQVGGNIGFWAMHNWLMSNPDNLTPEKIAAAAQSIGLDAAALKAAMDSPAVQQAIAADISAGSATGLQSIPWVYLNGRRVMRWSGKPDASDIDAVVTRLLDTAKGEQAEKPADR